MDKELKEKAVFLLFVEDLLHCFTVKSMDRLIMSVKQDIISLFLFMGVNVRFVDFILRRLMAKLEKD